MFLLSSAESVKDTPEYTIVDGIVELADRPIGWAAESLLRVVKFRGSRHLRGRHAFRITDDGLVVYPRIEALLSRPSHPVASSFGSLSSGVPGLDSMLGGGVPGASTTMVMGPSGAGKTTLALQFLSMCTRDEPGLLFSFYETPAEIRVRADEVCPPLASLLDDGIVEVLWQPPTEGLLDEYGDHLLRSIRSRGVRRLVIDGLSALQSAAIEPVRVNQYLTALMNELRVLGVTTVYTLVVPDIVGSAVRVPLGDLTVLSDNVVLMRYVERQKRLERLVSILKVQRSAFDPKLYEYVTTSHGLRVERPFDDTNDQLADALQEEHEAALRGPVPPADLGG